MSIFKQLLIGVVLVVMSQSVFVNQVYAGEWKLLPGYSLYDLYYGSKFSEIRKILKDQRTTEIKGTSGLSWADGRQASIIHFETEQSGKKWLYKCVDYFNKDMQQTGQECYELREGK